MSLDVSVYRRIELLKAGTPDDEFEAAHEAQLGDTVRYLWATPDFPDHAEGVVDGYYRVDLPREDVSLNLRASHLNFWRDQLCRMCRGEPLEAAWAKKMEGGPFVPLLDFGDAEGIIGPARCRQLASDFAGWADRAAQHARLLAQSEGEDVGRAWLELYGQWRRAFEAAGPDGVVQYH